jgi:hypothetical protein
MWMPRFLSFLRRPEAPCPEPARRRVFFIILIFRPCYKGGPISPEHSQIRA